MPSSFDYYRVCSGQPYKVQQARSACLLPTQTAMASKATGSSLVYTKLGPNRVVDMVATFRRRTHTTQRSKDNLLTPAHTWFHPYPSRRREAGPPSEKSALRVTSPQTRFVGLGCRLRGVSLATSLSISPLILRGGRRVWCAIEEIGYRTPLFRTKKHVSPLFTLGRGSGREGHHESGADQPHSTKGRIAFTEHTRLKSHPLCKGGRHGAALPTDLATEHLHALQCGLVTHG